jgi:hypothetical protein
VPDLLSTELDRREKFYEKSQSELSQTSDSTDVVLNGNSLLNIKLFNVQNEHRLRTVDQNSNQVKENFVTKRIRTKYIQCSAQTPLRILVKLIRNKYEIAPSYAVKLSHCGHSLAEEETLIQLFTSFIFNKVHLQFFSFVWFVN